MDTTVIDILARIEQRVHGIESAQRGHADQIRMLAERLVEAIQLLQPAERDGPSLDELLGHMIGQLTELTGYARQSIKLQTSMEQNLPADIARALESGAGTPVGANGAGRGNSA